MQLAIDAGNSFVKYGLFEQNNLLINGKIAKGDSLKSNIGENIFEKIAGTGLSRPLRQTPALVRLPSATRSSSAGDAH